jgi:hypothetical protein
VLVDAAVSAMTALRDAGVELDDEPAAGDPASLEHADRGELVRRAMEFGLEVPETVTDDQLRAALLLAELSRPKEATA